MSSDAPSPYRVEQVNGVTVIHVSVPQITPEMKDDLYALAARLVDSPPPRRVVLDMASVRILNSSAIGILINFQKRVRDAVGALKLCNLDPYVHDLFRLTRMDQVLDIQPTLNDALAAHQGKPRPGQPGKSRPWYARLFGK
jgi:anti-anti-sigma factor